MTAIPSAMRPMAASRPVTFAIARRAERVRVRTADLDRVRVDQAARPGRDTPVVVVIGSGVWPGPRLARSRRVERAVGRRHETPSRAVAGRQPEDDVDVRLGQAVGHELRLSVP